MGGDAHAVTFKGTYFSCGDMEGADETGNGEQCDVETWVFSPSYDASLVLTCRAFVCIPIPPAQSGVDERFNSITSAGPTSFAS